MICNILYVFPARAVPDFQQAIPKFPFPFPAVKMKKL